MNTEESTLSPEKGVKTVRTRHRTVVKEDRPFMNRAARRKEYKRLVKANKEHAKKVKKELKQR